MNDNDASNNCLLSYYENHSVIRGLVQLIPCGIGSAIDTALITKVKNIRQKRLRIFWDELATRNILLTEEMIQNEDFLHAYFATVQAVLRTRHQDKIRLFSRLLVNYTRGNPIDTIDEYEEFLAILNDLSIREFYVLTLLSDYEQKQPNIVPTSVQADTFWSRFLEDVENKVGIPQKEMPGFLARLSRTGLYTAFTSGHIGYKGNQGRTTPRLAKFIDAIQSSGPNAPSN